MECDSPVGQQPAISDAFKGQGSGLGKDYSLHCLFMDRLRYTTVALIVYNIWVHISYTVHLILVLLAQESTRNASFVT